MKSVIRAESWPIAGSFTISRGSRTQAEVVVVELELDGVVGRGESVPYARYNETIAGVMAEIEAVELRDTIRPEDLTTLMPAGAARAALDCALWDLQAKTQGIPVWKLAGLPMPKPMVTAYTLSLDEPEAMETAARAAATYELLKVKLGCGSAKGDAERIQAVRRGTPNARLIIDANEAWSLDDLAYLEPILFAADIKLVEQPLPSTDDAPLSGFKSRVPLCADESCHDRASLDQIIGRYDMINIKLNKTGGLTEAIALKTAAREAGLQIMVGCMVGTSLSMAPATLIGTEADYIDLDGPLLLAQDREPGIRYERSLMYPAPPTVWG